MSFIGQKIKVQGAAIQYSAADNTIPLEFHVSGSVTVRDSLAVGQILPPLGGSLYIDTNKWPSTDGTNGQTLVTDGNGTLSWATSSGSVSAPATQVLVGTGTGFSSDATLTYSADANTLVVGAELPGEIMAAPLQPLSISSDVSITLATNGTNRLAITDTGEFLVNSSAGTSGQVLTSAGSGLPPSWQSAGAETLVLKLTGSAPGLMDRYFYNTWSAETLMQSSIADWDAYQSQLRLDLTGLWRVTVKAWTRPYNEFFSPTMPNEATAYGTYVSNSIDVTYSQYYRGNANSAPTNSWSLLSNDAQITSWYDEFIVDARQSNPTFVDIAIFEECYSGTQNQFTYGAVITATPISGTPAPLPA